MATVAPPRATPQATEDRSHISRVPYLPGLDGMRALAVVAVMVYHANSSWLPGGFLGVEMFFVISGYLITLLLIAERERNYTISLGHFWLRRARRLLPALFMVMTLVTIWTALFERNALGQLRGDVIAGFFYVSNWYQIWVGLGYTSAGDFAPLRHLWSLAVEEQFYLFWPIVMVVVLGRRGSRRVADVSRWVFAVSLAITVFVALIFYSGPLGEPNVTPEAYWWLDGRPISKIDTLYLSTPTRLGGILLGAAFAMVWRPFAIARGPLRSKGRLFDVAALVGLAVFGWMCWNIYLVKPSGADPRLFQGGFFVAGLATLAIIAAVTHRGAASGRLLGNPVLLWIGTRSYGLYLYHWPIYQMIRKVAGNSLTLREFVFAMVLTGIVTELSYRFIEMPIRKGQFVANWRRFRAGAPRIARVFVTGVIALFLVVALIAAAALATAPVEENEIAQALGEGEDFTTDLLAVDAPVAEVSSSTTVSPTTVPPTTVAPVTTLDLAAPPLTSLPNPEQTTIPDAAPPPTTIPPTTAAPTTVPAATVPPAPVTQLGVITSLTDLPALTIPPTVAGFPLVALGDSVMLGAAEELQARGFQVDALKSRQMSNYLPEMAALRDNGTFGSVVIVHLGTNGGFSQATLDQMLAILADVPVVILLTDKADRGWIAGNNEKLRAVPASHPNVSVIDWEVLVGGCEGNCLYDDGIHLTQSGQNYYAGLIGAVLGQG
jgi:peptidoglycan/LPS O-acetylase OafA/YrhL